MRRLKVSKNEMKHTSRGIFSYIGRKPKQMLKGGHGERNLTYLNKHKLSHSIDWVDSNGVRHGRIDCHVRKSETKRGGHVWFPNDWDDNTIAKAGEHVANLKSNSNAADHTPMRGKFKRVHVVTYKSHGRICGICPNFRQKKGK